MIANMIYVALTALFYRLLKPVNGTISLLMVFFSLVGCTTQIIAAFCSSLPWPFCETANWRARSRPSNCGPRPW